MTLREQALPFQTEVDISDAASESQVEIVVLGERPGTKLTNLHEVLSYFISAANVGMLSGDRFPPTQSLMHVLSREELPDGSIRTVCHVEGVDPASLRILLGMITQSHFGHEPLASLRLRSLARNGEPLDLSAVLARSLPGRTRNVPFDVVFSKYLDDETEPVIRMMFHRPLEDKEFARLEQWIADWDCLLLLGGYRNTFDAMHELPMTPGETYLAAPNTAEHLIYGFGGPVVAFDALVNMGAKLHFNFCPLVAMEFE